MHVLLLEDDIDLGQAVAEHLEAHGHAVDWMKLCSQALRALHNPDVELGLFDLRLPDGDGLDVLLHMRQSGDQRPVIVLTARDQISDRIRGLQGGADDYLVKPFDLDELLARIDAVGRRTQTIAPHTLSIQGTTLDFHHKVARRQQEVISLTAMEWSLLGCLARRPGRIWSRTELEHALYDKGRGEPESNSLEVLVSRLRRKLGATCISTHRNLGYRLER